jgi:hypothetical protein
VWQRHGLRIPALAGGTALEECHSRHSASQAKLNRYLAIFDYLSAYFEWERATGQVESIMSEAE